MRRHTVAAILPGLVLAAAAGCDQARDEDRAAPRVARLVCEDQGARALTRRTRAMRDGIHIEMGNRAGAIQFYIRSAADEGWNHGGRLRRKGMTEIRTTMPPGEIWIACGDRAQDIPYNERAPEFAEVTVVDSEDLWIAPELDCEPEEGVGRFVGGAAEGNAPDDVEGIIREVVPGVGADDDLVRPGYPETQWHSEFRHVVRDGRAIASVSLLPQGDRWNLSLRRCLGADIG